MNAIIAAIEQGAHRAREIAAATGMKVESAHARLHELKRLGAVTAMRVPGTTKDRHSRTRQEKHYELRTI